MYASPPRPCKLTFDFLTLKVVSESHVTLATCVPILVFLGLSVLELFPMYSTDRHTDVRQHHRLMSPPRGHSNTMQRYRKVRTVSRSKTSSSDVMQYYRKPNAR